MIGRVTGLLLLLATLAGTSAFERDRSRTDESVVTATPEAPMGTTPAGTPALPEAALRVGSENRIIGVTLREWAIDLSESALTPGPMTLEITNTGRVEHEFKLEGPGVEQEVEHIRPGDGATLSVELRPGSYEFVCDRKTDGTDHLQAGMVTRLVVQG